MVANDWKNSPIAQVKYFSCFSSALNTIPHVKIFSFMFYVDEFGVNSMMGKAFPSPLIALGTFWQDTLAALYMNNI